MFCQLPIKCWHSFDCFVLFTRQWTQVASIRHSIKLCFGIQQEKGNNKCYPTLTEGPSSNFEGRRVSHFREETLRNDGKHFGPFFRPIPATLLISRIIFHAFRPISPNFRSGPAIHCVVSVFSFKGNGKRETWRGSEMLFDSTGNIECWNSSSADHSTNTNEELCFYWIKEDCKITTVPMR